MRCATFTGALPEPTAIPAAVLSARKNEFRPSVNCTDRHTIAMELRGTA